MAVIHTRHRQNDTGIDVRQRGLDRITTFQNGQIRFQAVVQNSITLSRKLHVRDRIGIMVILSGRIDDQIRLEVIQQRHDDIVQRIEEPLFTGFRWHRQIDDSAERIRPPHFIRETRARIQGTAVLMHGNEQRIRIMPENILRTVAMMAIGIDHSDPLDTVFLADIFDHDRFHVQRTETAAAMNDTHRMVTARTDQRESVVHFPGHHLVGSRQCSTNRNQMGRMDDLVDIRNAEMHPVDIGRRCQIRLVFLDIVEIQQAFLNHLILRVQQAFLTLRMSRRDRIVKSREKNQSCFLFHENPSQFESSLIRPGLTWSLTRMFLPVVE